MALVGLPPAEVQVLLFTCNRRRYFAEALESVLEQTYRDFHVAVIDDASDDGTLELAREYARKHPERVTVIAKPEWRGVAHSTNLGIALTKGARYVALHNDDDAWLPTKLEKQMAKFRENPELGFVATDAAIIDADGRRTGQLFSDLLKKPDLVNPAKGLFWDGNRYCAPSVVLSRTALDLVEPYHPLVDGCEDMYMWLVISARMPVAWLAEPLTLCRAGAGHSQMTSRRGRRQMWRETYVLRERLITTDEMVQAAVGGEAAGRARLDDNALYLARSYLQQLDLRSYAWFARKVLKRRSARLVVLLGKCTVAGLLEAAAERLGWRAISR
jgi:glycosyltransferase involved in cell wall biosynthesis